MAMLAEKRTKTRYYLHHKTLNPRGNAWCEDTSKFGQRMLEKMGWSQGKGLGINESGSTDPVHVSYKWDSKGMGYKGADADEAVAQQKDFDALLATLSGDTQGEKEESEPTVVEKSPKSLELMSQKSRARVHYHKFTRGKDLSRASSKDLASILGIPAEPLASSPALPEPVVPDVGPPIEQVMETTFGITTIAKGNINEYFKQKFKERKRKLESSETNVSSKKSKLSEDTKIPEAVDKSEEPSLETQGGEEASDNSTQKRKKKSKKKSTDGEIEGNACGDTSQHHEDDTPSTKGRRKSVTWGDVEVSFVSKYIKDMADTSSDSLEIDVAGVGHEEEAETYSLNKKKKKKDKKNKKGENNVVHETLNHSEPKACKSNDSTGVTLNILIDVSDDMEKKKKKKNKTSVLIEESNSEVAQNLEVTDKAGTGAVKKKRKKIVKSLESQEDDQISNDQLNIDSALAPNESKKLRKTKKSKEFSSDSDKVFVMDSAGGQLANENPILSYEEGPKVSTKDKKKKKGSPLGENLDNLEFQGEIVHSNKKKKLKELEEKNSEMGDSALSLAELPEEKKKKRKRKKNVEEIMIQTTEENETAPAPSERKPETEGKKSKKQKQRHTSSEDKEELKSSPVDQSSELSLSALTQERMAKWKERRKSNDKATKLKSNSEDCVKNDKTSTAKLEFNPDRPTHDYNHKRVFTALGYNVKNAVNKKICVQMPPSNFPGSNLDEIPGYGQAIKSC